MTKFYVDAAGNYIGSFGDGAKPPKGAIEVAVQPDDGGQKWNGNSFDPLDVIEQPSEIEIRLKALEMKTNITPADKAAAEQSLKAEEV